MRTIYHEKSNTYNFIHNNGVQTSIKLSPSGEFNSSQLDRDNPVMRDKGKYTVIISSSLGCQMACSFCHLTKLGKTFSPLKCSGIVENVLEAIGEVYRQDPTIASRYIKLCYMGEGEALLNMSNTNLSAKAIISQVMELGHAAGLDGIDIATSMPNVPSKMLDSVINLNTEVSSLNLKLNPHNHSEAGRSVVRLFYSLHHYDQIKRDIIIPNSKSISKTLVLLDGVSRIGVNVVVHYMFMKGVNDDIESVHNLVNFVNTNSSFSNFEFRVLRYNSYNGEDKESNCMKEIINLLDSELKVGKLKVQFSAGEEIKAACGMFL
jgi:adenine C2-methylase RlmN of 23S rRNA A2503 and tRNA A37